MSDTTFRFGSVSVDVTPPAGLHMAGYGGRTEGARGAHDPLYARASVCRCAEATVALCAVDVVGICRRDTNAIRAAVEQATGIRSSHVLVATTHTHAGPVTTAFRDATPDPDYMAALGEGIVTAVSEAQSAMRPARMSFGRTEASSFHRNRRRDGQPTDPTLAAVSFRGGDGTALGTWVNYGCHPTNLGGDNLLYSADYPGVLCRELEKETVGTATFFNGAHGDVNPHRPNRDLADVEAMGRGLARAVQHALRTAQPLACDSVDAGSVPCNVPLDDAPDADTLQRLAETETDPPYARAWAREQLALRRAGEAPATHTTVELQWFRLGGLTVLCFPGQLFSSWALELRERWAAGPLLIVNQANDHAGYFPDRLGWERGGYEVRSAFKFNSNLPAPLTWEAGRTLVSKAVALSGHDEFVPKSSQ